jgi:hypothetical protein
MDHGPCATSRPRRGARPALVVALIALVAPLLGCLVASGPAYAGTAPVVASSRDTSSPEQQLAERYAPVLRLVAHPQACGSGEPYRPSDVDPLFGDDTVALRGPWTDHPLVTIGPSAHDLSAGYAGYSLDFPGNPLNPGCDYEEWASTTFAGTSPTT